MLREKVRVGLRTDRSRVKILSHVLNWVHCTLYILNVYQLCKIIGGYPVKDGFT